MDKFAAAYSSLNAQQKRAVDTLEGPVLVIAGPGTGKTQILTTRIANILDKTDTLPQNILCLTFTESATDTMRQRLVGMIGQDAYNVTISTYHAFGSELIRRYPEYFSNSYDQQPVDDLTLDAIFRSIQLQLPYSNPLKHEVFLRDVKSLVSDFKRALLTPNDVRKIAKSNESFIQQATEICHDILAGLVRIDKKAVPLFNDLLQASAQLLPETNNFSFTPLAVLWNQQLLSAIEQAEMTGKTNSLTLWKNNWLEKDRANRFIVAGINSVRKMQAAADIYEQYRTMLAQRNLYDYDDMILQAIRGLEAHEDLRYSLQERYLYLLLDEFQDTNEAQQKLVQLLTDNPINEGRPNVLAVGDDDQAIYAFQGADYSHMLTFYQHYKDVEVIPLTQNYRSLPAILKTAEGVSGQIDARLHKHFPAIDKTLIASNTKIPSPAVVERREFISDLSQNTWIAQQIHGLIRQGVSASEIAILAPKHEYLELLVPFLHHKNISVHYDKRENVLDDQVVSELVLMSRLVLALQKGEQKIADTLWAQILSLTFWQLPTSLIWNIAWQARDTASSWTETLCAINETKYIALFFINLSMRAEVEPLESMLDFLIGISAVQLHEHDIVEYRTPFFEHYFGPLTLDRDNTQDYWNLLSNLTVLRQHIRDYRLAELTPLRLPDFIDFVEASRNAGIKILNTNPYQESSEAVQLMTAYKAKGQEYRAVFLVAAVDEVWGAKARNLGNRIALPQNMQYIRYAGTTEDERLRLLYVALTRAETHIYITSYTATYTGRKTTRLKYLQEYTNEDGVVISPLLPVENQIVIKKDAEVPELDHLSVYWQHRHYRAIEQPELKNLLQPRLTNFTLSATELNCFTDTSNDGPSSVLTQSLLCFPKASTINSHYGSAVHETLDWIFRQYKVKGQLPKQSQVVLEFENRLRKKRLGEPHESLLLQRGRNVISTYLDQRAHTFHANDFSEFNFRNEGIFIGNAHLTGKVDRLIVNPQEKTISIVDFKTGRAHQKWTTEIKLHAYRQQLYMYKILVENSHTFHEYTVQDAYLEFVEPDETGIIRELHLEFSKEFEYDFKRIIESVWQHIMNLQFPDVSAYTPDVKGIMQFQADLIKGNI
ncbi:MAG TPA: ATP-dependent DNA helicase [Candidatus Saccharimonadales bacterium]|nr:ATP-dependent DNA helicase [Candidatus Saccharimonadales bacterium]